MGKAILMHGKSERINYSVVALDPGKIFDDSMKFHGNVSEIDEKDLLPTGCLSCLNG